MTDSVESKPAELAAVFVDGSNFYNACVNPPESGAGVLSAADYYRLNFAALARKLAGPDRRMISVRYYVGRVRQEGNHFLYNQQQGLIDDLKADGVIFAPGRMMKRPLDKAAEELRRALESPPWPESERNTGIHRELDELRRRTVARALGAWLDGLSVRGVRLPDPLNSRLRKIHERWKENERWEEKEVDVKLAVDMISMARRGEYDVAYLLSGDSDFAPAVKEIRDGLNRQVVAVFPQGGSDAQTGRAFPRSFSSELRRAVNEFKLIGPDFFAGLLRQRRRRW